MSENLRRTLAAARLQAVDVAAALAVDPKTVNRWLKGRIPYPRHRWAVADLLQVDEAELWPEVASGRPISDDVRGVYPHRWAVPRSAWRRLFQEAAERIDILTYSGLFLAEDAGMVRLLAERAYAGVHVRLLLGDPDSPEVAARGVDEGIGPDVMAARIRNALALYRQLQDVEGVEIRLHRTVLYNSIYRADDGLLVNIHAYGTPAAQAPVIHARVTENEGTAAVYVTSLERVWATAEPADSMC
ncbi:XRE family transcriptional regulator [Microtetraspora fusca]|uniref:XRE family transcriptional regulator n=1 Tax=Microtetraspora fusca TaxID=1997 RepID=UPI0008320AA1|nr:XRE family transcriptional regulator [Microtetraspora fusca]